MLFHSLSKPGDSGERYGTVRTSRAAHTAKRLNLSKQSTRVTGAEGTVASSSFVVYLLVSVQIP